MELVCCADKRRKISIFVKFKYERYICNMGFRPTVVINSSGSYRFHRRRSFGVPPSGVLVEGACASI